MEFTEFGGVDGQIDIPHQLLPLQKQTQKCYKRMCMRMPVRAYLTYCY